MKKTIFKTHTDADLLRYVTDKREELRQVRFSGAGSKNKNVKHARTLRKDIARALTEFSNRRKK